VRLSTISLPAFSLGAVLAAACAGGTWSAAQAAPAVVASIKPVHSLVAAVMQGVGTPILLVEGAGSPHTYSLKPSQAKALAEAEVVFWVGEGLEHFLERPLESLAADAKSVPLMEARGMILLPNREGGTFEPEADEDEHAHAEGEGHDDHDHEQDHDHGDFDPHVWLDPDNATAMVAAIADTLAAVDPQNAERYRANADAETRRLAALTDELTATLAPVRARPFIVFHDAWHYFETRFGLTAAGSITVNPETPPGARRVAEIRDKVRELDATCVFAEPQFEPALVSVVIEGTGARAAVLDPLGADLPDGPDLYFTLLRRDARSLRDCLTPAG